MKGERLTHTYYFLTSEGEVLEIEAESRKEALRRAPAGARFVGFSGPYDREGNTIVVRVRDCDDMGCFDNELTFAELVTLLKHFLGDLDKVTVASWGDTAGYGFSSIVFKTPSGKTVELLSR